MFHEIPDVKQENAAGRRRWFEADGLDLIAWLEPDGSVRGFQLCYRLGDRERALTWTADAGFAHATVDAGDATPLKNEAPVLNPGGGFPWGDVMRRFDAASATLEPALRAFVRERLVQAAPTPG